VAADDYGLGPVQNLERDSVLERAVALVQQTFPGTVSIWDDHNKQALKAQSEIVDKVSPPAGQEPTTNAPAPPAALPSAPAPSPPPVDDDGRGTLVATFKELLREAFATGPNRGAAGQWFLFRMKSLGVQRFDDLTVEQLHRMCTGGDLGI